MPEKDNNFDKWYRDNREAYNAKRRERYRKDKDYRKRVQGYTENYRAKNPDRTRQSDGTVRVQKDGKTITALRIGAVATRLGCTAEAIRYLEVKGYIPAPTVQAGKIRTYEMRQVQLIRRAFKIQKDRLDLKITPAQAKDRIAKIAERWNGG